uniref:Glutamate racemase n=1 Tax=uncultured Aquificia bacterium TaxID=453415 RepID=H5SJP1_9BACT|nr:glutamate racemase [uncultured Aquificae bacterium]BAL56377.1 glutamate racemase [uncultured Aquificae bacterium]
MKLGVFDSGVGGLTVLKEIKKAFPSLDLIYLGDTARVPYGGKSKDTIIRYSLECAEFLIRFDIDLLVVACNTASSYALDILKKELGIPVFGVIKPGVRKALEVSKNKVIGVIGTKSTIKSGVYQRSLMEAGSVVYAKACPLFVPLVEEGLTHGDIVNKVIDFYLRDLKNTQMDTLILGCTHYPLLAEAIKNYMGDVQIVDSASALVEDISGFVKNQGSSSLRLFFTDHSPSLESFVEYVLGERYKLEIAPMLCSL